MASVRLGIGIEMAEETKSRLIKVSGNELRMVNYLDFDDLTINNTQLFIKARTKNAISPPALFMNLTMFHHVCTKDEVLKVANVHTIVIERPAEQQLMFYDMSQGYFDNPGKRECVLEGWELSSLEMSDGVKLVAN